MGDLVCSLSIKLLVTSPNISETILVLDLLAHVLHLRSRLHLLLWDRICFKRD